MLDRTRRDNFLPCNESRGYTHNAGTTARDYVFIVGVLSTKRSSLGKVEERWLCRGQGMF